jgi:hypothetical protein
MIVVRMTKEMLSPWLDLRSTSNQTAVETYAWSERPRLHWLSLQQWPISRGSFEKSRKSLTVSPQGHASSDDPELVIQAVPAGVGIGTEMEAH